ncbi:MAG: hypothetical protein Kow0069_01090 [Promethearchaeota archaeon]
MSKKQIQTRKLIKWGSSKTLIMSLPRQWIKKHDLTEKDEVQVVENPDDTLLILPAKTSIVEKKSEAEIVVRDESDIETVRYLILTKYIDGWDVLVVVPKRGLLFGPKYYKTIQELIKHLLGLEIVAVHAQRIVIHDMFSLQETNVVNLVKIISQNTLEFFQALIDLVKEPPPNGSLEEAVDRILPNRELITRYYYRIHRELRKSLLKPATLSRMNMSPQDVLDFAFFINAINSSAENVETQLRTLKTQGIPKDVDAGEVVAYAQEAYQFFQQGIDSFLFKKTSDAIGCLTQFPEFGERKRAVENQLDSTPTDTLAYQIMLDLIEKIVDATRTIALAALRRIA